LLVADRATAADVDTWARAHAELLARDGFPVRASYLARSLTDEPSRRAAFAFAAGLAILRGTFTSAQSDAFELLADALDLPADVAETLVGGLERALH
jgi:hypothetical protein